MTAESSGGLWGHQEWAELNGERTLTLRELWPDDPRAMIIGLNPAPVSVKAGRYYQGRFGQRQMHRLVQVGLFERTDGACFWDDAAFASGIGFADLVRRPTAGESMVSSSEIAAGTERITLELLRRKVPLVISVFRHPAMHLSGLSRGKAVPGFVDLSEVPGTKLFRMPGPTEAMAKVDRVMEQLKEYLEK